MGRILRRTRSHKIQALETSGTCRHRPRVLTRGPVIDSTALFLSVSLSVGDFYCLPKTNERPAAQERWAREACTEQETLQFIFSFFTKPLWLISCKIMASPQLGNTDSQNARKLSTIEPLLGSVSPIVSILLVLKVDVWKGQSVRKGYNLKSMSVIKKVESGSSCWETMRRQDESVRWVPGSSILDKYSLHSSLLSSC